MMSLFVEEVIYLCLVQVFSEHINHIVLSIVLYAMTCLASKSDVAQVLLYGVCQNDQLTCHNVACGISILSSVGATSTFWKVSLAVLYHLYFKMLSSTSN